MYSLLVTYRSPIELKPNPANSRTHTPAQVRQVARSIKAFGFLSPVLLDENDLIVAGHCRVEAAKLNGLSSIPAIRVEHLTHAQKRAFIVADNRLAELSAWDEKKLALELEELQVLELDFEITDIGFEVGEIDRLISDLHNEPDEDPADRLVAQNTTRAVARRGDLWALGKHRLFCGDALDPSSYEALLGGQHARMIFTDVPYNVPINGHVSGRGKARHPEFAMASGEMSSSDFCEFLHTIFRRMTAVSADGSIHFVCMDGPHLHELLSAAADVYQNVKNICVWDKGHGGMGSLYRSQVEFIAVLKQGTAAHTNNVQLGRFGRNRTTLWKYPGMNSFQAGRAKKLAMHPTVKPVALVADAILDCSVPKDIILDPFAGSGTTLIAAHRTGRRGYVMEIDAHYVDVSLQRFFEQTGIEPVNLWTGATLSAAPELSQRAARPSVPSARRGGEPR